MRELLIRDIVAEDDPALEALFERAFKTPCPAGEWAWKYGGNPAGRAGVLASLEGEIVGHFGAWMTTLWCGGHAVPAVSASDSMTDPSARVRGRDSPFLKMGSAYFDELTRDPGRALVFGFPSARARSFGERFLDYRLASEISVWRTSIDKLSPGVDVDVEVRETVPEGYDVLWERLREEPRWRLDKSRERLNWRYHARPHRYYRMFFSRRAGQVQAAAVVAFSGAVGHLVELMIPADLPQLFSPLMSAVAESLRVDRVRELEFWTLTGAEPPRGARTSFTEYPSGIPFEVRPINGWPDPAEVRARFELSMGDFDVY